MTHNLDDLATDILYHGGKPVSFYVALHGKDALIAADQDSAAAVAHLTSFKENYAARLMSMGVATRFVVYGNPDSSVREALEGFGVYMSPLGGFIRKS